MGTHDIQVPNIAASHASARDAVDHAIKFLEAALAKPRFRMPKGDSVLYREMRRDLPYVIHETSLPGTQILLNRHYKPLGYVGETWVNYEATHNGHVRLTPEQIASVAGPGRDRSLFGDGDPPWLGGKREPSAYLVRLKALRALLQATAVRGTP